jgi:hypothetical protein
LLRSGCWFGLNFAQEILEELVAPDGVQVWRWWEFGGVFGGSWLLRMV